MEKVNEISHINIDIDRVLSEGVVTACDFAKDISINEMEGLNGNLHNLKRVIPLCNKNNQQYPCSAFRNGSITINKAVNTRKSRYRLTIYDKALEIRMKRNQEFRNNLINEQVLLDNFEHKVRFELNAYSSVQIQRWLNINDTLIPTVLESEANPIKNALNEVFNPVNISEERVFQRDQDRIALLKGYDWDMVAVEANVREHDPRN